MDKTPTSGEELVPQWHVRKRPELYFCVTDKEIFDVLMSSRQRLTDAVLLDLVRDRGIFYSTRDSRESIASKMSLLTYDYHDLNNVLKQREHAARAEKVTSLALNATIGVEEIKEVVQELTSEALGDETIVGHKRGANGYVMDVAYSEVDFGKTRLVQRRRKEAAIEFVVSEDKTLIRFPANAKAAEIVEKVKARLEEKKKLSISADMIHLSDIPDAGLRTEFFTTLISTLPDYRLFDVTSVKVGKLPADVIEEDMEPDIDSAQDEEEEEKGMDPETHLAATGMLAVVTDVLLKGNVLLSSPEYRNLRDRGFFITSIIWRAKLVVPDHPIVEFEAAFEEPEAGRGFKYNARGVFPSNGGKYTKHIKPLTDVEKQKLLSALEQTATRALQAIRAKAEMPSTKPEDAGEAEGI